MCFDGDGFYTFSAVERYRKVCRSAGACFSYIDHQPKPIFSYVEIDGAEFGQNTITRIREKEKISDYANTGVGWVGCACVRRAPRLRRVGSRTCKFPSSSAPHLPGACMMG